MPAGLQKRFDSAIVILCIVLLMSQYLGACSKCRKYGASSARSQSIALFYDIESKGIPEAILVPVAIETDK